MKYSQTPDENSGQLPIVPMNKDRKNVPPKRKNQTELKSQSSDHSNNTEGIVLNVQGIIVSGQFFDGNGIFCKYDIEYGPDWKEIKGQKTGQSQHACLGEGSSTFFVWNMPFEWSLKTKNPSGWPQLAISCFCPDFFGREVLKAYGVCHIPTTPGTHIRNLQMFSPISSSVVMDTIGFFWGQKAELINAPKVLCSGDGREIIRTRSEGSIRIMFTVQLKNMEEMGFS